MVCKWSDFIVVIKLKKKLRVYGFGESCFNIRDICIDFELIVLIIV